MVHSNILYTLLVTLLHCAGGIEEPHCVHENGDNKSVEFAASVSFIVGDREIFVLCTCIPYSTEITPTLIACYKAATGGDR